MSLAEALDFGEPLAEEDAERLPSEIIWESGRLLLGFV
jgi:hypothetical protein